MADNEVAGVEVQAPPWRSDDTNWGYGQIGQPGTSVNPWGPGGGGGSYGTVGTAAINFANSHITIDPGLNQNDPNVRDTIDTARETLADLYYAAMTLSQQGSGNSFVSMDGTIVTASQYLSDLSRVSINITSSVVGVRGAQTVPSGLDPSSATFRIDINPTQIFLGGFTSREENLNFIIFHELGHATPNALAFNVANGYGLNSTGNVGKIEAYANTFGMFLAGSVYYDYPEANELTGSYGLLPMRVISGGVGNDILTDNAGADLLIGGSGTDTVDFALHTAPVNATLAEPSFYSRDIDAFVSIEDLKGSAFSDYLTGSSDANAISGASGDDIISGGSGDDVLSGGEGNDYIHGGPGYDTIMGNQGHDTILGGQDGDAVRGGQGNDLVIGDIAADLLFGDLGDDTLTGGLAADVFYASWQSGKDRITDFNRAEGDRVVAGTTTFSAYQSGQDTIVDFQNGAQLTLSGVNLSSLDAGWISA